MLWGEVVSHAAYTLNRVNTKSLKETTPYELWTGRLAHVEYLIVFGCVVHMKLANIHLKKLDEMTKTVVHLGIEKGMKSYRLLDPNSGLIYASRDKI